MSVGPALTGARMSGTTPGQEDNMVRVFSGLAPLRLTFFFFGGGLSPPPLPFNFVSAAPLLPSD